MDEYEINKLLSPRYALFLIPILGILIGAILFSFAVSGDSTVQNKDEAQPYGDYIAAGTDDGSVKAARITVVTIASFASKGDLNYYFALDPDGYIYLLRITDDTYESIEEAYESDPEGFSYDVYGWTHPVDSELKKYAIESINDYFEGNSELTEENYEGYLGKTYLDETVAPNTPLKAICVGIGIGLFGVSIVVLVIFTINAVNTKKSLKEGDLNELHDELAGEMTAYKKEKVYLTKNFVVSTQKGLKVFRYTDFYWVYNEVRRVNAMPIGTFLNAGLINRKLTTIASSSKNSDNLDEIMMKIQARNDRVLIGFTDENRQRFKAYKKGNIE